VVSAPAGNRPQTNECVPNIDAATGGSLRSLSQRSRADCVIGISPNVPARSRPSRCCLQENTDSTAS
jgi:hypothetical protein